MNALRDANVAKPQQQTKLEAEEAMITCISKSNSLGDVFDRAKREFVLGRFPAALALTQKVAGLVTSQVQSKNYGRLLDPTFSIVVVTYREIPDVYGSLSRLAIYSKSSDYEIVIVNNGNPSVRDIAKSLFENFLFIEIGFNYGCSGARNVGVRAARGEIIVFVDDDGLVEEGAIENLIDVMTRYDAVAVRGRVLPKTSGITGRHYDIGHEIVVSGPNAECLLAFRRGDYVKFGGFDPLLAGHEGWALCSRIYPYSGPDGFLYTPNAIIHHDYSSSVENFRKKRRSFEKNKVYLKQYYPLALDLMPIFSKLRKTTRPVPKL